MWQRLATSPFLTNEQEQETGANGWSGYTLYRVRHIPAVSQPINKPL